VKQRVPTLLEQKVRKAPSIPENLYGKNAPEKSVPKGEREMMIEVVD